MLNNTKAEIVWNHIKDDFNYLESNIKECIQPNLKYPVPEPVQQSYILAGLCFNAFLSNNEQIL